MLSTLTILLDDLFFEIVFLRTKFVFGRFVKKLCETFLLREKVSRFLTGGNGSSI